MKVADVISRVRNIAGDTSALQFSNDTVLAWINDGVCECAMINNLLQKNATSNTVIGTENYTLPTDILRLHSVKYDSVKIKVLTLEEFDEQYTGADFLTNGTPVTSYVWADQLTLYPPPDAVKELQVSYIYKPATLDVANIATDEIPLPVSYHQRIVDYCLAQVAQQDDDMNRYQLKMQQFTTGVQDLKDQGESTYDLYSSISVASRDMGEGAFDGEF